MATFDQILLISPVQPIDVVLNSDGMSRGYVRHVKKYAFYGCCSVTARDYSVRHEVMMMVERMKGSPTSLLKNQDHVCAWSQIGKT